MRKFLLSLFSIFFIAFSANAQTYKIAVDAAYPPFSFKQGDTFVGIELDMLAEIAKRECFSYELKFMNFDGVIPGLVSGQIDGALDGINISDERKKIVDFSDGYFKSGLCVVTRVDDDRIKQFDDLKGKTNTIATSTSIRSVISKAKEDYQKEEDEDTENLEIDRSFYTNSSGLKSKDFDDLQEVSKAMRKNNILIVIVLIVLFAILLFLGIYFGMKAF